MSDGSPHPLISSALHLYVVFDGLFVLLCDSEPVCNITLMTYVISLPVRGEDFWETLFLFVFLQFSLVAPLLTLRIVSISLS